MKKISMLLLVFCIIFTLVPCAFAKENTGDMGRLIAETKDKIGISDEDYEFDTYYENTHNGITTYSFSWKSKKEDSSYIRAEVKNNGTIVYYSKTNKNDYSTKFLKYSKEETKEFVLSFFEKIGAPTELSEPEINKYGSNYEFSFNRVHEGIEVSGNSVRCTVSGESGEVVRYNLSWTDNLIFNKIAPISIEKAKEIYLNELGYELFYTVVTKENKTSAGLVYKPKFDETAYIDAVSGEVKTYSDFMEATEEATADRVSGGSLNSKEMLSEKELSLLSELEGLISIEEATEKAKNITEFEIDDNFSLESSNIHKRENGKYTVSVFLTSEDEDNFSAYKNVLFDGETGKLLGYSSYSSNFRDSKNEKIITDDEGKKIAEEFLKKTYKDEFSNVLLTNKLNKSEGYYEYKQVSSGIKVSNCGITIKVDLKTAKISSVSYNLTDTAFPKTEGIEPIEEVYKKLLSKENFTERYLIVSNKNNMSAVLVYDLISNPTYDANSLLEVSSYDLEPIEKTKKPEYTDISGHYAESRIKRVVEENIYLEGNELFPEKAITNKEFASLVYMALSGSEPRPLDDLYKSALGYLSLDVSEEKEDKPITRLDAIKILLNNMGYKEFAQIKGIFNCPFTDVSEEDKGYAAIAAGLKLVSTADRLFYKDADLRRADAFIIIYNYMSR